MSQSLTRLQAILLGLVVLAAVGLGGLGVFAIGSRQWLFGEVMHLEVGFKQVRGVAIGTRVRVQGVEAGEVEEVRLPEQPGADVILRLRLAGTFRGRVRSDATAQIVNESMVGGKVVEIDPGTPDAAPIAENGVIASRPSAELADVMGKLDGVLQGVRDGKGSLGKLMQDDQLHSELVGLAKTGRGALSAIQQDAEAVRDLPIIRGYVKDAHKLLVRPDCEMNRQWFTEAELFEPGYSVLTAQGRQKLDQLVPWLEGLKHKNSEVVIAAYSDPGLENKWAQTLSQKQSDAVAAYLKNSHAVQKMGWFSRRPVTPIGLGTSPSPMPAKDKLPAPRVEVVVFVPQG